MEFFPERHAGHFMDVGRTWDREKRFDNRESPQPLRPFGGIRSKIIIQQKSQCGFIPPVRDCRALKRTEQVRLSLRHPRYRPQRESARILRSGLDLRKAFLKIHANLPPPLHKFPISSNTISVLMPSSKSPSRRWRSRTKARPLTNATMSFRLPL